MFVCLFVFSTWRKSDLHTCIVGKERSIVIDVPDNCGCSLIPHPLSKRCGIWSHINESFLLFYIKIHMRDSVSHVLAIWKTLVRWPMRIFSKCWHNFLFDILKIPFTNFYHQPHHKNLSVLGSFRAYSFPKINNFLFKSSDSIIGNRYCQSIFLTWQAPFVHFRKFLSNTQFWTSTFCLPVILFSKNSFLLKKKKKEG